MHLHALPLDHSATHFFHCSTKPYTTQVQRLIAHMRQNPMLSQALKRAKSDILHGVETPDEGWDGLAWLCYEDSWKAIIVVLDEVWPPAITTSAVGTEQVCEVF